MGHARSLLSLPDQDAQLMVLKEVMVKALSVRATEKLVKSYGTKKVKNPPKVLSPDLQQAVDHLSGILGSKINLSRNDKGKGSITIHFQSDDDLNRILDLFDGN
jgi:ParB family chromosome partitioning protein